MYLTALYFVIVIVTKGEVELKLFCNIEFCILYSSGGLEESASPLLDSLRSHITQVDQPIGLREHKIALH